MSHTLVRTWVFAVVLLICSIEQIGAQKISLEDVLVKHRESIGAKDKLEAIKNQLVLTDAQFTFKGSALVLRGKALILSAGGKSLWGMNFNSNDYPVDRFAFDGKDIRVGRPTPSSRSLLGEFIFNNHSLLKNGLLGGTLSSSWALLNTDNKNAKISYEGIKTIDGKEALLLSYAPKGGSDVSVKIYFDPQSYRHIRTEYTLVRAAATGSTIDNSAGQSGTIYKITEDFSDFSKVSGITLPRTYKITYARSGTAAVTTFDKTNRDAEWTFTVISVGFNRELDQNSFNIDG
jgi:hypothetical protein